MAARDLIVLGIGPGSSIGTLLLFGLSFRIGVVGLTLPSRDTALSLDSRSLSLEVMSRSIDYAPTRGIDLSLPIRDITLTCRS